MLDHERSPGEDGAREEERRRRDIARDPRREPPVLERPDRGPAGLERHGRAEPSERPLGVVAGGGRLEHGRIALGRDPGEQDGALDLGAGDRGPMLDPGERSAPHGDRGVPVRRSDLGAHRPQRLGDALHRPSGEASVALQDRLERLRRDHPRQQPHRRARVQAVQRPARWVKARSTSALEHEPSTSRSRLVRRGTVTVCLRGGVRSRNPRVQREFRRGRSRPGSSPSPSRRGPLGGLRSSLRPSPVAARINHRCAIDLSPGTRARPPWKPPGRTIARTPVTPAAGARTSGRATPARHPPPRRRPR